MVYLGPKRSGIEVIEIVQAIDDGYTEMLLKIYCDDVSISISIQLSKPEYDKIMQARSVVLNAAKEFHNPQPGEKCQNKNESSH